MTANDVARLTNPSQSSQPSENATPEQATTVQSSDLSFGLSATEKSFINNFLENTLFYEGYEVHDGDLFHVASGRSLLSEAFVSILKKLTST